METYNSLSAYSAKAGRVVILIIMETYNSWVSFALFSTSCNPYYNGDL